jgi:urease accessory protein
MRRVLCMRTITPVTIMPSTIMLVMTTLRRMFMTSIAATITIMAPMITTVMPMRMTTSSPADFVPLVEPVGALSADEGAALYRLMTWLSPAFPVGAFSYSSGIEWAVEAGDIVDAASLQDWLSAMLTDGAGFCDGVFAAHTHRTATGGDTAALRDVAELAAAFVPSRERQLETTTQGKAFIEIARSAWSCEALAPLIAACDGTIVYPSLSAWSAPPTAFRSPPPCMASSTR